MIFFCIYLDVSKNQGPMMGWCSYRRRTPVIRDMTLICDQTKVQIIEETSNFAYEKVKRGVDPH